MWPPAEPCCPAWLFPLLAVEEISAPLSTPVESVVVAISEISAPLPASAESGVAAVWAVGRNIHEFMNDPEQRRYGRVAEVAHATKGKQAGTYYGSGRWGWRTDAKGSFTKIDLAQASPPLWSYVWLDDHPTVMQRLARIRAWEARYRKEVPSPGGS